MCEQCDQLIDESLRQFGHELGTERTEVFARLYNIIDAQGITDGIPEDAPWQIGAAKGFLLALALLHETPERLPQLWEKMHHEAPRFQNDGAELIARYLVESR